MPHEESKSKESLAYHDEMVKAKRRRLAVRELDIDKVFERGSKTRKRDGETEIRAIKGLANAGSRSR
jgi:hypothetical protein